MKAFTRALAVLALVVAGSAAAEGYPQRPVKIIVPAPAGQSVDVILRLMAPTLLQSMGQPIVVDNRPGGSGLIAINSLIGAAPDGYTALVGSSGTMSINPHLMKMPADWQSSMTPVSMLATLQYVLVAVPSFPANSLRELVALTKANPGKHNYVASSAGTTQHLAGELLKLQAGLDVKFIPHLGSTAALNDLMGGRVSYGFETIAAVLPLIRDGRLKALGVTSLKRSSELPDVPTIAESTGLADFNVTAWIGLFVRAGSPPEVATRLAAEVQKALQANDIRERFVTLGMDPVSSSPAELARVMSEAYERFGNVIKRANIKVE